MTNLPKFSVEIIPCRIVENILVISPSKKDSVNNFLLQVYSMSFAQVFAQSVFFTQFLYLSYVGIVLQMRKNPVKKNDENGLIFNRLVVDVHHGISY